MNTVELHRDYSGAFCALACLRSSLTATAKAMKAGNMVLVARGLTESRYWADQFIERRASARRNRGYVAPLPEGPLLKEWRDEHGLNGPASRPKGK